jgi:ATP phosphoribosyltransferase
MNILKLGIPKGSLENNTVDLFKKAGWRITYDSRSYFPDIDDPEINCTLVRAQEMSRYIEDGHLDLGLTGIDWILENNSDVVAVQDLVYSKVSTRQARWVLVVRDDSPVRSIEDMEGKHISTELVNFTKRYFAEKNIKVSVEFSWGATEAKVVDGLVDAVVEVTETGSTIRANKLRIVHELMRTNTQLIANRAAWDDPWKRKKIEQIRTLLTGSLLAVGKSV